MAMIKIDFPPYQRRLAEILTEAETNFPSSLTIDWNRAELTLNQTEPLVVPYPTAVTKPAEFPQALLLIVPISSLSSNLKPPDNLPMSALAVVTQQQLFLTDFQGGWSQIALADLPGFDQPFHLNRQTLPEIKQALSSRLELIFQRAKQILPVLLPMLVIISQFFSSIFYALIGFLMLRLINKPLPWIKVWQIALHLTVVALSVQQLTNYLYQANSLPLYSLTFWSLFILIGWGQKPRQPTTGQIASN